MFQLNLPHFNAKIIKKNGKTLIFDILRRKYVALTPEEFVRQHFINFLVVEKGFPAGRIANEISICLNNTSKRCDTVVYDRYMQPLVVIEYKAPDVPLTEEVFNQIMRYNCVLRVKWLIISNGISHYCFMIDYETIQYTFVNNIPNYDNICK
ncbi:MAG: type I restriction enzyme HsdR N-terminal domain-containing protein [Tannerella sp.]|jgi:hypothetical protein|nr:type I restriction enzyme HsdR N-terminal domain-containing protein [Tannerella sp.]